MNRFTQLVEKIALSEPLTKAEYEEFKALQEQYRQSPLVAEVMKIIEENNRNTENLLKVLQSIE